MWEFPLNLFLSSLLGYFGKNVGSNGFIIPGWEKTHPGIVRILLLPVLDFPPPIMFYRRPDTNRMQCRKPHPSFANAQT